MIELIKHALILVIEVMIFTIIGSVIISWLRAAGVRVPYYHPVVRAVESLAETMLRPLRHTFPMTGGGFDFTPMAAIILLEILRRIIERVL